MTLAIQNGEGGGDFEYAPMLRSPTDENYEGVARVLAGNSPLVRKLVLQPGDLQIFRGRYSLHRVAPVEGPRKRYVGIFSFVEKEGMCGGVERTKQLYGVCCRAITSGKGFGQTRCGINEEADLVQ